MCRWKDPSGTLSAGSGLSGLSFAARHFQAWTTVFSLQSQILKCFHMRMSNVHNMVWSIISPLSCDSSWGANLPRIFDLDFTPMLEKPQVLQVLQVLCCIALGFIQLAGVWDRSRVPSFHCGLWHGRRINLSFWDVYRDVSIRGSWHRAS